MTPSFTGGIDPATLDHQRKPLAGEAGDGREEPETPARERLTTEVDRPARTKVIVVQRSSFRGKRASRVPAP